jgi:hypothetical protein
MGFGNPLKQKSPLKRGTTQLKRTGFKKNLYHKWISHGASVPAGMECKYCGKIVIGEKQDILKSKEICDARTVKKKAKKKKKKKALTRQQIIKKIDRVFSRYVRYKYAVNMGGITNTWRAPCVTCKTLLEVYYYDEEGIKFFPNSHAGHFIDRGIYPLRWDERNVHPQCRGCNTYRGGNHREYTIYMIDMYGRSVVDELREIEKKYKGQGSKAYTIGELRELLTEWENRYKELVNGT